MAIVTATITVNFTAAYNGCHRVCYGTTGDAGPFPTCTTANFAPGPASFNLNVSVDTEACEPTTFYGYVQACCELASSENGRISWSTTYTPTPLCVAVRVVAGGAPTTNMFASNMCTDPGEFDSKAPGTTFYVCYEGGTAGLNFLADDGPTGWTARGFTAINDPSVCCGNCYTYEVDCGAGATYQYINCAGALIRVTTSGVDTICAKEGSISANNLSTITITQIDTTCILP